MKLRIKIFIAGLLILLGIGLSLPYLAHSNPAVLYVHVISIPCDGIVIESSNLERPVFFTAAAECKLSPIRHGVYRIGIKLKSGETAWSEFLHHDEGKRRRIDVFVNNTSKSGWLRFLQTANEKQKLFEGEMPMSEATQQKPFRLDWI